MTEPIGRERELARINALLTRLPRSGGALLLRGEAGIGKSVLLEAARRTAFTCGFTVLSTAGVATETGLPYAGLHRLLQPLLGDVGALAPALRAALGLGDDAPGDPYLVALAVLDLLGTQAPVLVLADDLHWLDAASRTVLTAVGREIGRERIALIAAQRDGYEADIGVDELCLGPVDGEAAAAILDARAVDGVVRARLLRAAGGNPLALVELPTEAAPDGTVPLSARLERAFADRVRKMPPATRALLVVAAAAEASSVEEIVAAGAASAADLEPAVAARLIALEDGVVRYRHSLVRSAIYQAAPLAERLAAHEALGARAQDPDRRALHRAAATVRRDDEVAAEVEAVASRAVARGAVLDAATTVARAAGLTEDPRLRGRRFLRSAELAFEAGRPDLVRAAVEEARKLALDVRDSARADLLAECFDDGLIGDVARVRGLVADAGRVDADLGLELLRGAAVRCWWGALDARVRAEVAAGAEALDVSPLEPRLLAILACAEPLERGAEVVARAVAALGEDPLDRWWIAMSVHAVGDHRLALDILLELAPLLREHGRVGLLAQVLSMVQWDAAMLGEWELTEATAAEGDRLARATGQRVWGAGITCGLSAAAAMRGDAARAARLAGDAERAILAHGMADMHSVLIAARGIAAVAAGRHEDAYAILARAFDPADPAYHYREQFGALRWLAVAATGCGREDEAIAIIDAAAALTGPSSAPALLRGVDSARALLVQPGTVDDRVHG